jgi:DNA-binding NarL/FixJ family response regulator
VLEAGPVVRQMQALGVEVECLWTLARLELLEGAPDAAVEQCRELLRRWEATEDLHYSLNALAWAAGVFAAQGEGDDLQRCVRALSTIAAESGTREALALLAGGIGDLALFDGAPAVALEHFQRAIDLHAAIELPHDLAELLVRAAAAARAAGHDDLARTWLGDARLCARRLGARPLQAAAERELAELGGGTETLAAGLTPRQLQIIRRVAAGRTNREIAAELVLSVRTVDMHVRNSLIALGCRSRVDAARMAGELGLLEPSR